MLRSAVLKRIEPVEMQRTLRAELRGEGLHLQLLRPVLRCCDVLRCIHRHVTALDRAVLEGGHGSLCNELSTSEGTDQFGFLAV